MTLSRSSSIEMLTDAGTELDKGLEEVGQFGPYQMRCYALLVLSIGFSAYYSMTYVFTARDLTYRCYIRECEQEGGPYKVSWLNEGIPLVDGKLDDCHHFLPISHNGTCTFDTTQAVPCTGYVIEDKQRTSIVSSFNIYCKDKWKLAFFGTMNNVGQFLGLPLVGYISDRFGRKFMLVSSLVSSAIVGIVKSFSPSYWSFVLLEVLDAVCGDGTYSASFIMAAELTSPRTRVIATTIMSSSYTVGEVALGLAAWYNKDWRDFLRFIYTPALLFIVYIWILPESMRWLLAKGKGDKALKILDRISASNKRPLSQETREMIKNKGIENEKSELGEEDTPLLEIIKSPKMILRLVNCSFTWITHTLLFYGLSLNSVTIAGNMYSNFIWVCVAELPGYVFAALSMDSTGRRPSLSGALTVSGVSCLLAHFVPKDMAKISMALFFIGKCAITMSFTVLYVYTAEMFPTNLRHSLLGFCSTFGRIGSMIAPQAPLMAVYIDPMLVFGGVALTAACLSLFFPETVNQSLPDNVNQAKAIDKKIAYS